jgi:pyruvate-formate lyase
VGMALANTCDALLAIRQAVFAEAHCTMAELLDALDHNYEDQEPLRQFLLRRVPKWGNNDPASDALARRIADDYCDKVHTLHNARGGPLQAALFSLDYQWTMGQNTGARPDGRKAREALAPGVGSAPGRDQRGATALINSVTQLDFAQTPNGTVLDLMLHPSAVRGEEGLDAFVALIKTFFARGGYAIQCNVLDVQTLREAQRDPERYASLQIRVTGWSVFFVTLPREQQDQFIVRNVHRL